MFSRGRAPVNCAILRGERETGATLHYMVERADAGDIVDQLAVPILADDDAREVFAKVTVAAETILARSLEPLVLGRAPRRAQPIEPGQYFGRRRPEDGRIDWHWPARQIHDLVRAVAPPFPGASAAVGAERWQIHRTRLTGQCAPAGGVAPRLYAEQGQCLVACGDGQVLRLLAGADARGPLDLEAGARSCNHGRWCSGERGTDRSRSMSTPIAARAKARCGWRMCSSGLACTRPSSSASARPTGRAIRRAFRRGFLGKVKRTSVLQHYGLKTCCTASCCPGRASGNAPVRRGVTSDSAASRRASTPGTTCAGRTASARRALSGRGAN
jgi:hypothetical protein